ncbi:MAG: putative disease resistance protein [Parachlamydiales bacterium]|nr:putative disease resistance protein [Parachlamydiales bacterium]
MSLAIQSQIQPGSVSGQTARESFWNHRAVKIVAVTGTVVLVAAVAGLLFIPGAPLVQYGAIIAGTIASHRFAAITLIGVSVIFMSVYAAARRVFHGRSNNAAPPSLQPKRSNSNLSEARNFFRRPIGRESLHEDELESISSDMPSSAMMSKKVSNLAVILQPTSRTTAPKEALFKEGLIAWCNEKKGTLEYVPRVNVAKKIRKCFDENEPVLDLNGRQRITSLPEAIGFCGALKKIDLSLCIRLAALPEAIGSLVALNELDLSGCCRLIAIPKTISSCAALKKLGLSRCTRLTHLPEIFDFFRSIPEFDVRECVRLAPFLERYGLYGNVRSAPFRARIWRH